MAGDKEFGNNVDILDFNNHVDYTYQSPVKYEWVKWVSDLRLGVTIKFSNYLNLVSHYGTFTSKHQIL